MESFAERIQQLSIEFPPFIIAVIFHEWAHGLIAYRWGDNTAKDAGRLTLNPVPHIDPVGTLLFPMINMIGGIPLLFGWARPVPINPNRFRKFRPGLFCVSIAGVSMNVLLACISAAIFCGLQRWVPRTFYLYEPLVQMAGISVTLNYALCFFNLVPLPPLDGSKIIESFLPYNLARKYESLNQYSFFILIALLLTGAFSVLRYPILFFSDLTLIGFGALFNVSV